MGLPEREAVDGRDVPEDVSERGLGQMDSAGLKLGGTHRIAVKNVKQTGADLWSFHVVEGPVYVKSSHGACLESSKNCLSSRQW